jgi:hypothetical protein
MTQKEKDDIGFNSNRSFPHWDNLYTNEVTVSSLPWYNKELDADLGEHLGTEYYKRKVP